MSNSKLNLKQRAAGSLDLSKRVMAHLFQGTAHESRESRTVKAT